MTDAFSEFLFNLAAAPVLAYGRRKPFDEPWPEERFPHPEIPTPCEEPDDDEEDERDAE